MKIDPFFYPSYLGCSFPANGGIVTLINYFPKSEKFLVQHGNSRYTMNRACCAVGITDPLPSPYAFVYRNR